MKTKIILNGEQHEWDGPARLSDLLEARRPRPPFAVEVNKRLVRRNEYEETELREGDRVEIVTLVGGG